MPPPNPIGEYLGRVSNAHCPFIGPAHAAHALVLRDISGSTDLRPDDLSSLGCVEVERLRLRRRAMPDGRGSALCCTVLVLPDTPAMRLALRETHFILKRLYTNQGLLFGKFWPGQSLTGENGRRVAEPPKPMLVMRSSLPRQDLRFFERKSRPFREDYLHAKDNGAVVVGPFLTLPAEEMAAQLARLDASDAMEDPTIGLQLARAAYTPHALAAFLEVDRGQHTDAYATS